MGRSRVKSKGKSGRLRVFVLVLWFLALALVGVYYFVLAPESEVPEQLAEKEVEQVVRPDLSRKSVSEPEVAPAASVPAETGNGVVVVPKLSPAMDSELVMETATPSSPPVMPRHFVLQVGALPEKLGPVDPEKIIRELGYESEVIKVEREARMIRLLVGTFPLAEARERLTELSSKTDGAFLLIRDEQASVYAGSYWLVEQAQRAADELFAEGILVEREEAMLPMVLRYINFGEFTDQATALAAAANARAMGLKMKVVVLEKP